MKTASFNIAILNFFSRHGQYFHPTKDQPWTRQSSTFLYICYNFRQIFCTYVIQFFSAENMGHNQLKKCTKYHLVSYWMRNWGLLLPIFCTFLSNSALIIITLQGFLSSSHQRLILHGLLFSSLSSSARWSTSASPSFQWSGSCHGNQEQSIFSFRLGSSTEWSERLPMPMEVTPVKCFHWIQMTQRIVFFCSSHRPGDLVSRHDRHCFPHALCLRCHPGPGGLFPKKNLFFTSFLADGERT